MRFGASRRRRVVWGVDIVAAGVATAAREEPVQQNDQGQDARGLEEACLPTLSHPGGLYGVKG